MKFDSDPEKSKANKAKHGIDFIQGQAIWADPNHLENGPGNFTEGEQRWLAVGMALGSLWTACMTMRGEIVRIISIRPARAFCANKLSKNQPHIFFRVLFFGSLGLFVS